MVDPAQYMAAQASALSKFLESFEEKIDPTVICDICHEDENDQMTSEANNKCSHEDCKVTQFKEKLLHRKAMFELASKSFSRNPSSGDTHNEAEEESSDSEAGSCCSDEDSLYPSVFYKYIKSLKAVSNPDEKCSICNRDEDDRTISLFCGHHFHKMCMIVRMGTEGYGCPKCHKLLLDITQYRYFKMLFGIDSDEEDHEDPDEDLYHLDPYDGC